MLKAGAAPDVSVTDIPSGVRITVTDIYGDSQSADLSDGKDSVYVLGEGETLADAPSDANVVIDPDGEADDDGDVVVDLEGVVRYTKQELTDEQKAQARENIGANAIEGVVKYDAQQMLTYNAKLQARNNIDAASQTELDNLSLGVVYSNYNSLKWDGAVGNRSSVVFAHNDDFIIKYVHVSNDIPDLTVPFGFAVVNGLFGFLAGNAEITAISDNVFMIAADDEGGLGYIMTEDNVYLGDGVVFPKKGIYLLSWVVSGTEDIEGVPVTIEIPVLFVSSLSITGHTFTNAPSYNDLKDKPFGMLETGSDTITYDGKLQGDYVVAEKDEYGIVYWVKVSDSVPTVADMEGKTLTTTFKIAGIENTTSGVFPSADVVIRDDGFIFLDELGVIIPTDNYVAGDITFPSAGLYFLLAYFVDINIEAYISSLTIPGYKGFASVKTIDPVYLPEPLQFGSTLVPTDTVTYNGEPRGPDETIIIEGANWKYVRISDAVPSVEDMEGKKITLEVSAPGGKDTASFVFSSTSDWISVSENGGVVISLAIMIVPHSEGAMAGVYSYRMISDEGILYVSRFKIQDYTGFKGVAKIDPQYIPDTIQRVGDDVIINSSTAGSTKKFKITVDDSGTISATEVT